MFVTKQILNDKSRKSMMPHQKQILSQIKASFQDQNWNINHRFSVNSRPKSCKSRFTRPQTASCFKKQKNSILTQNRVNTQQKESQTSNFMRKINYQFNQIKQITSLFDNFFELKTKKSSQPKINFSQKVQKIKKKIRDKQNEQKNNFNKMKRLANNKNTETQANIYMGYPIQKVKKVIPASRAKHQDINMITRCIKGGYFDQIDEFSQKISKNQLIKLKKNFITLNTLYDSVRGKKNKGIRNLKPQSVDRNSFQNYVYFLQNQKNFKITDKIAIQQKINLIS